MYKITNKLKVNLTATDKELKEELIKNGLEYSYDKVDSVTSRPIPDKVKLRNRLAAGTCFTFWCPPELDEAVLDKTDMESINSEPKVEDVATVYASVNHGFSKLEPGKFAYLAQKDYIIESLINTGYADKIIITDETTGNIVWDGGIVDVEYTYFNSLKDKEEGKEKKGKSKIIVNMVHPEKLRKLYTPTADEIAEKELQQEAKNLKK